MDRDDSLWDEHDDVDRALEQYARRTINHVPELKPLLADHVSAYGPDILAHVLFGEISQWARDQAGTHAESAALRRLIDFFQATFAAEDVVVQELITVSFLENVCDDPKVTTKLPATLSRQIP